MYKLVILAYFNVFLQDFYDGHMMDLLKQTYQQ